MTEERGIGWADIETIIAWCSGLWKPRRFGLPTIWHGRAYRSMREWKRWFTANLQMPWLRLIRRTKKERREENETTDKSLKCQGSSWHNVVMKDIKTTKMMSITKTSKKWRWPTMATVYDDGNREEDSKKETVQDHDDDLQLTKWCDHKTIPRTWWPRDSRI